MKKTLLLLLVISSIASMSYAQRTDFTIGSFSPRGLYDSYKVGVYVSILGDTIYDYEYVISEYGYDKKVLIFDEKQKERLVSTLQYMKKKFVEYEDIAIKNNVKSSIRKDLEYPVPRLCFKWVYRDVYLRSHFYPRVTYYRYISDRDSSVMTGIELDCPLVEAESNWDNYQDKSFFNDLDFKTVKPIDDLIAILTKDITSEINEVLAKHLKEKAEQELFK